MGEKRDAYVQKLKGKLDEWNTEIDKLQAKSEQIKADAKDKYQKHMDELMAHKKEVETKLAQVGKAGEGAWQDLKGGMDKAWKAMGESVQAAKTRFKK